MFDAWFRCQREQTGIRPGVAVSALGHVLLVVAAVQGTRRPATLAGDPLYNRVYYLPPPPARLAVASGVEKLEWVELAPPTFGGGTGPGRLVASAARARPTERAGDLGTDETSSPPPHESVGADSVYSELEVDSVAMRDASSASPEYPLELLRKRVEGAVRLRYVVDSTGRADSTSISVLSATDPGFATAVREALPRMRFSPARIGSRAVLQIVEQSFSFRIRNVSER